MAEKVCRGMPSQSAQAWYSRDSLMRTSPTSNQTARIGTGGLPGGWSGEGGELFVQGADGGGGSPGVEGGAQLAESAGAGGVAGLVQLLGVLGGDAAGVVNVAVVQLDGGQVGQEDRALLDGGAGQRAERGGQLGACLVVAAGAQGGVAGVGVHLRLHRGQPGGDRAVRLAGEVLGGAVQVIQRGAESVLRRGDE